jgi:alkanesulfonate monooxygenase SsuD/methylene tetrahydromethanopterin reductase-like flavin-dependent oxidoreductase (luciferase family)
MREPGKLAVLGAGHVGPVIARPAIKAGYPVAIAPSGDPEDIALISELIIPGRPATVGRRRGGRPDVVVLAIPLSRFLGRPPLPVLVHSPGHIAATDEQARAEFWPPWRDIITLVAAERGFAIPTEDSFDRETGPRGALYVGSPDTVARKIATNLRVLGATRFDLKYGMPGLTHDQLMTNIELYGHEVNPRVRELL